VSTRGSKLLKTLQKREVGKEWHTGNWPTYKGGIGQPVTQDFEERESEGGKPVGGCTKKWEAAGRKKVCKIDGSYLGKKRSQGLRPLGTNKRKGWGDKPRFDPRT